MGQKKFSAKRLHVLRFYLKSYPTVFHISKFCFLCMPELHKLIFCNWIRRLRSVRPANAFMVILALNSTTVTRKPLNKLQKAFFGKSPGANGLKILKPSVYFKHQNIPSQSLITRTSHKGL